MIVTGTSAQGAVATTTNGAAQRGYKAVVPVDGMSAEDAFNELYADLAPLQRRPGEPHRATPL